MNTQQTKAALDEILKTEAQAMAAPDAKAGWLQSFNQAASPPAGLAGISVPPCQPIIGNWFKQGDLGFIHGPRGLGKTWLAMILARKCAEGSSFGGLAEWHIHGPRRALYVDGEMSMDGIRERDHALAIGPSQNIIYLQHEALFHLTGRVLNLTDPDAQAALLEKCRQDKIDILLLDNLSCLFSGIRENDADAWDRVLPWLGAMTPVRRVQSYNLVDGTYGGGPWEGKEGQWQYWGEGESGQGNGIPGGWFG
jgi:hypothetical protein